MIGFFDSGLGGLTILHAFMDVQPGSYMYLGDNQRAPYGNRSAEEVLRFTLQGVQWLVDKGCTLIVLACNTASAHALREIQTRWLPYYAPHVRVLGVLVPTVEAMTGMLWHEEGTRELAPLIAVFATPSTVASGAYEREVYKRLPQARVIAEACPELVPLIERHASQEEIRDCVRSHVQNVTSSVGQPGVVLLGCTHYALIAAEFREAFGMSTNILSQPEIVAQALCAYLKRHPEFVEKEVVGARFFTTGEVQEVTRASELFFGKAITYERVALE